MQLTYEITMLPLLSMGAVLLLLSLFALVMYRRTNIVTDLYLTASFGAISLLPLSLYFYTASIEVSFGEPYHVAGLIVMVVTVAVYWLAEKRTLQEKIPYIAVAVLVTVTLVLPNILAGIAFGLIFIIFAIWLYLQHMKRIKLEGIRFIFYLLMGITPIVGNLFLSNAFAFLYAIIVLCLLLYEAVRYFERVVSLLRNAGINSITDSLTQLFNKGYLLKKTDQLVRQQDVSVIFCDIDNFKQLNDTKGHDYGDQVLINAGKVMKQVMLGNGYVCRYGGEELVCVVTFGNAVKLAEEIRANLQKDVGITASIGVASSQELAEVNNADKGLKTIILADKRMYKAKQTGKNRVISSD
jgi:diguanylate cyclase (GGDEF)-like protein